MSREAAVAALPDGSALVDGKLVDGTGEAFAWVHPGDGAEFAARELAGPAEVEAAVTAARSAFGAWASAPPSRRRDVLLAVAATLRDHADELAALVTLEMGLPMSASRVGPMHAAEWFSYYAGWADKIDGVVAPVPGAHGYTAPTPYGVVGAIIPWNGPIIAAALKLAPALAAGNCVVLKPSELAPFSSIRMAQLAVEAGLPAGVLNVVGGRGDAGQALCENPDVRLISFTGGDIAGQAVAAAAVRILGVVDAARDRGDGRLVAGGARLDRPGSYVTPTLFADVDNTSPLAQAEVFGPVLSVLPFDDEDEAVALANDSRFGLAGYVWTRDVSRAHRVAAKLDAGYVSVNSLAGLPPSAPFGGWKASGHGAEGGAAGIREFLRTKNIHVAL